MKKKILFISHMYPTSFNKSYGKVIHEQAISLIKRGYEIKVICPVPYTLSLFKYFNKKYSQLHNLPIKEVHDGIEVFYLRYLSFPRGLFYEHSGLLVYKGMLDVVKSLKKSFDFGMIHAHFGMPDAYAAMELSRYFDVPLITTIQATDLDITIHKNNKCKNKVKDVLEYSNEVISPSPRLQSQLMDLFNIKSNAIGYGFDINKVVLDTQENLSFNYKDKIVIMSVSRLIKSKGLDCNIKAINKLKESYGNILYLIVGDGPEKENLIQMVKRLGLDDYVNFLGELNHLETMQYINISDIFSLPSWQETFGLVYLEAMANKKPVIGCRGQGFDGIIEHQQNGFLAMPKDTESVYKIIKYILSNPLISEKIGRSAKETAINNFTFDKIASKIDAIYRSIS